MAKETELQKATKDNKGHLTSKRWCPMQIDIRGEIMGNSKTPIGL